MHICQLLLNEAEKKPVRLLHSKKSWHCLLFTFCIYLIIGIYCKSVNWETNYICLVKITNNIHLFKMYETEICVYFNLYYYVFKYLEHIQFIITIILSPFTLVSFLYDW